MKHLPHPSNIFKQFLLLSLSIFLFPFYLGLNPASTAYAAIINVTTTADELDGITGNGVCSLREAIENANNDNADQTDCLSGSGDDVITLPAGIYKISADLIITDDLTIIGAGADVTVLDRNAYTAVVTQRVFYIASGLTVNLNDITVQNGHAEGYDNGGGIYNQNATLNINDCAISSNSAGTIGLKDSGYGAGIFNDGGDLKISTSTISNNVAVHRGGGIANENGGKLTVKNSTFTGNKAQYGGAIVFASAITPTGNIETSAFISNTGIIRGGGVHVQHGYLTINNSTFSGNAGDRGAGLSNRDTLTVTNSTISDNNTWDLSSGSVIIDDNILTGTLTIQNSIVANDVSANPCTGEINDGGNNLEFPGTSCGGFSIQADPLLDPLNDNGGPTLTHALQTGSPAIDIYTSTLGTCPATDQRGVPRPQPARSSCDIGAFEYAQFAQYRLYYAARENGNLSGDTYQIVDPGNDGSPVVAVPNSGYHFVIWSDGSTANPRTDTNVTYDIDVTANFDIDYYNLNILVDIGGSVENIPGNPYTYGQMATIIPVANENWVFIEWSGDDSDELTDNGDGSWSLIMDGNKEIRAIFKQEVFFLYLPSAFK